MAKKKKAKKLTPEERRAKKIKADHTRSARGVFRNVGFQRAPEVVGKDINFKKRNGELDDVFVSENLIVLVEYTTAQSDLAGHLQKKKLLFSRIASEPKEFVGYLRETFPEFESRLGDKFHDDDYLVCIVYCSRYDLNPEHKALVEEAIYLDYPYLKYFEKISSTIKRSSRFEFFEFLQIAPEKVAHNGKINSTPSIDKFPGSILPEKASGYPPGHKVVSFYADASALLRRAFVLRRDGWRSSFDAYQRIIQAAKIEAIRKKLKAEKQVFVNNLIVTLPEDTLAMNGNGSIDITKLKDTAPVIIALPGRANCVGLVDGQHRLFSYYESENDDPEIAKLREQQNLLVTGIIYPKGTTNAERERFEAALFLAINSHQTSAPPGLRQEIEVLLRPFSQVAIGRQVMALLAKDGPLNGHVENYFFDKGKLKTTSIVNYGLGPLIKLGGNDSLFAIFKHSEKAELEQGKSQDALEAYLTFSKSHINMMLSAVKNNVAANRWTTDPSVERRILTVTYINSFLIVLRFLIRDKAKISFDTLQKGLDGIDKFAFHSFHSSQYVRMAEAIYAKHFA